MGGPWGSLGGYLGATREVLGDPWRVLARSLEGPWGSLGVLERSKAGSWRSLGAFKNIKKTLVFIVFPAIGAIREALGCPLASC